jgi:glycosyltransferase involved in cell wall biosynthesis
LSRPYFNLPYFSNLKRFECCRPANRQSAERVFIYSGSLTHRKGVDILARAFVALVQEGHNVKLRIIGNGPLRSKLQRELTPAADKVDFVGFIDWQDLPQQYALGSFLCVPSRYDGWGLVVPEGLASGLPVIATDQMGAGLEFIQSGYNGWLIPANNRNALLSAMRDAASLSQEDLSRLSSNARKTVDKHTLQDGAHRFMDYAIETVGSWKF